MNLNNIQPASGSTHNSKELVEDKVAVKEVLLQKVTKVKRPELVTLRKSVLKEVRCLCKEDYLNSVSKTLTEKSSKVSTWILSNCLSILKGSQVISLKMF